ncbi:hypothetical protein AtubIFM61612_004693 [Aspergillus tubingensis]|nr:hypothetical protein AtubIFM61612_004693 [Aspergillus tubingensis]
MTLNTARNESALESWKSGYLITPENEELHLDRLHFREIMRVSAQHLQDNERLPSKSSSWDSASQL